MGRALVTALVFAMATATFGACGSSGGGSTSTPTVGPTVVQHKTGAPAITEPQANTLAEGAVRFRGEILETYDGCPLDATCSVTVRVSTVLEGDAVAAGDVVTVIESHGYSPYQCYGDWSEGRQVGWIVEILAGPDEVSPLAICDESYYERIVSTPTP